MMKREANGSFDAGEGSRPKRARRAVNLYEGPSSDAEDEDVVISDGHYSDEEGDATGQSVRMDTQEVKRHGMQIWQSVKDAVSKDGRYMSPIFMQKPSKTQYPDYYEHIKRPIALEDIKKKIEKGAYPTLEDVRQDFELCFNNAKQYNMKESMIWRDAKDLLKLVNKSYNKIIPNSKTEDKASKPPSLNRLLKTRLQAVTNLTDRHGRYLSTEFMDLPDPGVWAIYYQQIKEPRCFNDIFKKLKRKAYAGAADFAEDVELIFSNAMAFNLDHTPIWENALTMKKTFKQLMSDLPPQYALPQYQSSAKIKIKPPAAKAEPAQPSLTFKVPATSTPQVKPVAPPPVAKQAAPTPAAPRVVQQPPQIVAPKPVAPAPAVARPAPKPAAPRTPQQVAPPPQPVQPVHAPSPLAHPVAPQYAPVPHVSSNLRPAAPHTPVMPSVPSTSSHILRTSSAQNVVPSPAISTPPPPAPPVHQHQLKSIRLQVQPRGRVVCLHHTEGVRSWALRMLPGETGLHVSDVAFLENHDEEDEEESSEGEEDDEDDYEDGTAMDTSPRSGKKKTKGRKRGRPTRASMRQANTAKSSKKRSSKPEELQLKINGQVVKEKGEQPGEWDVHVQLGYNTLEVGEVGGMIWKVYAERVGTA